jgi:hypothetical protein
VKKRESQKKAKKGVLRKYVKVLYWKSKSVKKKYDRGGKGSLEKIKEQGVGCEI